MTSRSSFAICLLARKTEIEKKGVTSSFAFKWKFGSRLIKIGSVLLREGNKEYYTSGLQLDSQRSLSFTTEFYSCNPQRMLTTYTLHVNFAGQVISDTSRIFLEYIFFVGVSCEDQQSYKEDDTW